MRSIDNGSLLSGFSARNISLGFRELRPGLGSMKQSHGCKSEMDRSFKGDIGSHEGYRLLGSPF